jgi:hypothetical protein
MRRGCYPLTPVKCAYFSAVDYTPSPQTPPEVNVHYRHSEPVEESPGAQRRRRLSVGAVPWNERFLDRLGMTGYA